MTLNFYVRFYTKFGQSLYVSGTGSTLGDQDIQKAIPLKYLNHDFWHGQVVLQEEDLSKPQLRYNYIFKDENGNVIVEWENERIVDLENNTAKEIAFIDTWNHAGTIENAFYTKPFQDVFFKSESTPAKKSLKKYTHEFRVKTPMLKEDEVLCIAGSDDSLQNWETEDPLLLNKSGNWWTIRINLEHENFPISYKYGVYNIKEKEFQHFESGNNRILPGSGSKKRLTIIHDGFAQLASLGWKGAGVALPVFSLRSQNSFGTGEFTDIKLFVDWANKTGLKLIQLLPVNDTTATHTWKDSYPYSAISAFALHPLYLNLAKVAGDKNASIIQSLKDKQQELNNLPVVDYEEVMNVKFAVIKELYAAQKKELSADENYKNFIEANRDWLIPYAAFCYLRDKYKSADPSKWNSHSKYDVAVIEKLVDPTQKNYDEVALHYFTQYHLHLQLKEATAYAHKNGVVVKGDLPIGISRQSCDAWVNPDLYNMDMQAGAPPDDFAIKGQNWGFPTYNWKRMQQDHYDWWRLRFEQMGHYFDAFRIDHILGFFRIWSIPLDAVEGILGHFVPAIPIHVNELYHNGIAFNPDRYCKPYIDDSVVNEIFYAESTYVKQTFLDHEHGLYRLKPEFNTQRKVECYFDKQPKDDRNHFLKYGLFDLISNIIFVAGEGDGMQQLHFRINMYQTISYKRLDGHTQHKLYELYINYFYHRQDAMWKNEALKKLPDLKHSTDMLVCGEDLGMVPHCVPDVMDQLGILSLEIQRMPKQNHLLFAHPADAPYLSVITPSTHDMSTVRGWWHEDREKTQFYFNNLLGHYGAAPQYCEAYLSKEIIVQHLYSPAMWCVFQLQDILGMSQTLRRNNPDDERINIPADPNHYWRYRMHLTLEDLITQAEFNGELNELVVASGR